ncbi:1607_t:CDS:2, partial [Gigaspora margarita]
QKPLVNYESDFPSDHEKDAPVSIKITPLTNSQMSLINVFDDLEVFSDELSNVLVECNRNILDGQNEKVKGVNVQNNNAKGVDDQNYDAKGVNGKNNYAKGMDIQRRCYS